MTVAGTAEDLTEQRRTVSSTAMLARRVAAVGAAYRVRDENALREELRLLAREAGLLAASDPLLPSLADRRLRVAIEREPMKAGGS